jgi:hypothetical protein
MEIILYFGEALLYLHTLFDLHHLLKKLIEQGMVSSMQL